MAALKLNPMIEKMDESVCHSLFSLERTPRSYTVAIFSKVSNMKSRGVKVNGALCVPASELVSCPF